MLHTHIFFIKFRILNRCFYFNTNTIKWEWKKKKRIPSDFPSAKLNISRMCVFWIYNIIESVVMSKWQGSFNRPISNVYFVQGIMLRMLNLHIHGVRGYDAKLYIYRKTETLLSTTDRKWLLENGIFNKKALWEIWQSHFTQQKQI